MGNNYNIHLFEEHSSSLPVWWSQKDTPRTIVYLDAHLDLQKINDNSLDTLYACTSVEEIQNLEAPHYLNPSPRYAYGIENFLYAAHKLKLIDRLIWVAPPHIPRGYSHSLIHYMSQMDGISFDELISFKKTGHNAIRGSLLGLDITICDYNEVSAFCEGQDYYLDIDIDYFIHVPSDRLWIDPAKVINGIREQLGDPLLTTISRAVNSGFTPLTFRYIGDYIHRLLSNDQTLIDYYQKLTKAVFMLTEGNISEGKDIILQAISLNPALADAYFILSQITDNETEKNNLISIARQNNNAYKPCLSRDATGLLNRKKPLDRGTLLHLANALDDHVDDNTQRVYDEIAVAQLLSISGDHAHAKTLLEKLEGDFKNHEELLLAIVSKQLSDSDKREQNRQMLDSIRIGEKNATAATVYLGDLEYSSGNYENALNYYSSAHDRSPAWFVPLDKMYSSYLKLGMNEEAQDTRNVILERQKIIEQLASQASQP